MVLMGYYSALALLLCGLIGLTPASSRSPKLCSSPLATSINDFGFKLFNEIDGHQKQLISPLSIYTALAMAYLGTGGKTANEIASTLQLTSSLTGRKLHQALKEYIGTLPEEKSNITLRMVNVIFSNDTEYSNRVNRSYKNDTSNYYKALSKHLNFARGHNSKRIINLWAERNTSNNIYDILKRPFEGRSTLGVLMDAIYFNGNWKIPFTAKNNGLSNFNTPGLFIAGGVRTLFLYNQTFPYVEVPQLKFKFIELPYKGDRVSMLLALPLDTKAHPKLNLTSELLCNITGSMRQTKLREVRIPLLRLYSRQSLVRALQGLGINELFSWKANMTGISNISFTAVKNIIHQTRIAVDETSTEAAAVTIEQLFTKGPLGRAVIPESAIDPHEVNVFIADHPFLLYVIDKRNGLVLFAGKHF